MGDYILEMQEITKEFPGVKALDRVSYRVKRGEVHALVGENGAGKSTLMKVLSGVHKKTSGKFFVEGVEQEFSDVKESEKAGIAIVHQELNIVKNLTICENIFLGNEIVKNRRIDWGEQYRQSKELLDMIGLDRNPGTPVSRLSAGQQQMVEIARAIHKKVKVLIFDEPTSSLTEQETETLLNIIRSLQADGVTIIYISHKLNEIFEIAQTVTVLRDGQTITTRPISELDENSLISYMVGRELTNIYPTSAHEPKDVILEVEGWTVENENIPGEKLLDHISITARRGEILGIAGLMGAGRTEFAMSIFGAAYKKSAGTLKINGRECEIRSPKEAIAHGIGYVTEDRKKGGLVLGNSLRANVALPNLAQFSKFGIIDNNEEITKVSHYLKELQVKTPSIMQLAKNLSGGNQQKVILAKWLMADPDILIIDEPTRGIDVGAKYEIYTILDRLAAEGKCIILISSEMPEIIGTCDRVYVMNQGKIVGELDKSEITQTKIMQRIQGGIRNEGS